MFLEQYIRYLRFLKNKGQGRYFDISEAVDALNNASMMKFNEELTKYEEDQRNSNLLRHFKTSQVLSKRSGKFVMPDDYEYFSGFTVTVNGAEVVGDDLLTDDEFLQKKGDVVAPATEDYPYARIVGSTFEILPPNIGSATLYYIKRPQKAVAVTSISANGNEEILDVSASTDLDWPETAHPDLVAKAIAEMGWPMKDDYLLQYKDFTKANQQ